MKKTYYINNGQKIPQEGLPEGAYVLSGISDENDKGLVTIAVFSGGGTSLVPLCHENGKQVRLDDNFGKTLRSGEFVNN